MRRIMAMVSMMAVMAVNLIGPRSLNVGSVRHRRHRVGDVRLRLAGLLRAVVASVLGRSVVRRQRSVTGCFVERICHAVLPALPVLALAEVADGGDEEDLENDDADDDADPDTDADGHAAIVVIVIGIVVAAKDLGVDTGWSNRRHVGSGKVRVVRVEVRSVFMDRGIR